MAHLHRQFPDNIKVILADDGSLDGRVRHYEREFKSKSNPNGIPAWKVCSYVWDREGQDLKLG